MNYLIIGGILVVGLFVWRGFKIRKEVLKREAYVEPANIYDTAKQLGKRDRLYIMDGITKLVSDSYGNIDKSGLNASIEISKLIEITTEDMKKYKYVPLNENAMAKALFVLKKWQRKFMMTCFVYVYQNLDEKSPQKTNLINIKSQVLQFETENLIHDLNSLQVKSFDGIYELVSKNSKITKW